MGVRAYLWFLLLYASNRTSALRNAHSGVGSGKRSRHRALYFLENDGGEMDAQVTVHPSIPITIGFKPTQC